MPIKNLFFKGVSRQPSDSISEDGQLAVAMNVAKDNEIDCSIIEKPKVLFPLYDNEKVLLIHANNQYKHYLVINDGNLSWIDADDRDRVRHPLALLDDNNPVVSVMGNTLILGCNDGIRYAIWNEDDKSYTNLGHKPPMVNITFSLNSTMECYPETKKRAKVSFWKRTHSVPLPYWGEGWVRKNFLPPKELGQDHIVKYEDDEPVYFTDWSYDLEGKTAEHEDSVEQVESTIGSWTAGIMGHVNKFIADKAYDKNKFCMPFFVRYCYEMYDGSMIMHSYPVLMTPSSKGVFFGLDGKWGLSLAVNHKDNDDYERVTVHYEGRVYGVTSDLLMKLEHTNLAELKKWKDLIKSVGIYVTPPIYTHEQGGKVTGWTNMDDADSWDGYFTEGTVPGSTECKQHDIRSLFIAKNDPDKFYQPYDNNHPMPSYIVTLPYVKKSDYDKAVTEAAQFYRIGEIEFDELVKGNLSRLVMDDEDKKVLNALTAGQLMKDDYHTHDLMKANVFNVYNRRLSMGDVVRTIHAPISPLVLFPKYDTGQRKQWKVAVYTKVGGSKHIVVSDYGTNDMIMPRWFFYPDSNAYKAVLNDGNKSYEINLKEHKLLEGAYWMASDGTAKVVDQFPEPLDTSVVEQGKLYTTPAENPFYFDVNGVNEIGDGKILAMAQAVQAMSEGQFGMHPMYCFTTQGVWALSVKEDGNWGVIHPVTRDVMLNGTKPLSIDTSVIFISGRGVMLLSGRTSKVIDTVINGEWNDFHDKLADIVDAWDSSGVLYDHIADTQLSTRIGENTKMMYDYKHQRVYFSMGDWSWVLNMLTWSWTQSATHITTELNSYPNCEFVQGDRLVSLDQDERYPMAVILTRHVKTGGEFLAKVHRVDVVGNLPKSQADVVGIALYGSPDWRNNVLIASSTRPRITRIGGTGMKTHSMLVMMRDTDRKTLLERAELTIDETKVDKIR